MYQKRTYLLPEHEQHLWASDVQGSTSFLGMLLVHSFTAFCKPSNSPHMMPDMFFIMYG